MQDMQHITQRTNGYKSKNQIHQASKYIKNNNPKSSYAMHILNNRHAQTNKQIKHYRNIKNMYKRGENVLLGSPTYTNILTTRIISPGTTHLRHQPTVCTDTEKDQYTDNDIQKDRPANTNGPLLNIPRHRSSTQQGKSNDNANLQVK